ncbi:MAG: hypothetical protein M1838_005579 [Thelocarpon superellum]|nr:MAG: hypothetical protein M1838_005579 [Thelocarpon superellum]
MPHATSFSDDELEYIINHVLLPPRLPHEDDAEDWKKQDALLRLVHERAQAFVHQCSPSQQTAWQPALRMLARSISINQQGVISEPALSGALRDMAPHDAIMLTIKAQNAGLIFTKVPEASVVVDAFEIAATTEAVVGTTGRLIRTFPGSSVRFSSDLLRDPLFLAQVTARLCQLAVEVVASTMPTTRKAGETLVEERDTAAPFLVTECLMNVFAALGGACESEAIQKHTRDDVVYHHSKLPWRRSPSWLVLRVALQMTLSRAFPHDPCHAQYKSFMLFLLSDLCSMATLAHLPVDTQKLLAAKVAGRVWKLGSLAEKFVLEASLAATQATRCALESAWVEVRGAEMTRLPTLQTTVVDKDMAIVLSRGRDRLVQAMLPPATSPTQSSFRPQHLVRSGKDDLELPQLTQERGPDRFLALADVELWVSGNLAGWLDGRLQFGTDVDESCRCLAALLRAYITTALEDYQNNPRERSMMLLVTLEMACAHSTSQVIAEQSECSPKLTVLEYLAFGSLRAGERLQWRNILRELGLFNLSFNEEAVMSLILQAIWQAGSPAPDTIYRTAHEVFKESAFSTRLLEMLWRRLSMVEANWREQNAMFILVAIALRALSLAPTSDIAAKVIAFLRSARVILGQWSRDLTAIQHGCTDEDDSKRNMDMLSYAACICRMTYDVDSQHVRSLLADAADVATFIECSVLVHDNTAGRQDELPPYLRQAVERNQKISHASEDWLRHLILQDQTGINCAMASIWQDVTMRDQWQVLPSPNERWVINTTADSPLRRPQSVCYNLLSGSLLVDGNPLGRLPSQYVEDPIYRRVFGSRILHVFASDMPGMSYMTARDIHGHQLHLGVWGQQLRIKARRGSQVLELIPLEFFQDDLPEHFAVNFVHWINVETGEIEFRPLSTLWHTSPENWRLHFSPTASSRMTRGQDQMIDHRSNVASQIMTILNAIEDRTHMHITWKTGEGIEAELPRFNLRFFVDQTGHLRSRELAAVVDQDQSIGTLCGLCSRLVLRDVTFHEHLSERSVLVPHGVVHVTKRGEHVRVRVNPGDSSQIRYFRYKLDLHLQKLRGPPGRLGELYKAYLHAVTSYVLADPFTGRTGTEEALISLRNESLRLSTPLETAETRVLHAIAALSPKRTFYPVRLRRMEVVFWDANLSELAQHEEFSLAAREIETHAARFAALYDGNAPEQSSGSALYNLCRFSTRESDTYQLMFLFGFVAFGDAGSLPDIHVLLAFAFGRFEDLDPPPYPAYALEAGAHPVRRQLSRTIRNACVPFERRRHENHDQRQRRRSAFERDQAAQVESFCQNALDKWPCEALNLPDRSEFPLIKVKTAHRQVEDLLASWFHNKLFLEHINRVQERLEQMTIANIVTFWPEVPLVDYIPELPSPRSPLVNLSGLLSSKSPPPLEKFISALVAPRQQGVVSDANRYSELRDMILTLRSSHCPLRQEYGKDLQESLQALEAVPKVENPVGFPFDMTTLLTHRLDIETQLEKMMSRLKLNLGPTSQIDKVIESADIWPRLTPQSLLAMLSATNSDQISKQWREYLVVLGEVITLLQRVNRLIRLQGLGNVVGSYRESENGGREGWSAVDYPEWLLMEIENDFMIRRVQATVALAMIRPEDARNSVLQLNMGEGKSSVIIPMVAVALADRRRLVRVIVLKPLLRQTEYLLSQRLGGLVNRRVYHTPFSRQTPLDPSLVAHLQEIFEECKGNGGVLLALPEHILSFRLMGRERLSYDRTLATHLMETEKWLQKHARDVLDESDEILATHFQLVYTTGLQQPMDGQPDRWTVCQKMLSLVRKHAGDVQAQDPGDLEVGGREHAFPTLRFCSDRAGRELVSRLVRDLTHGAGSGISYGHCPSQVQEAVVRFICRRSLEADDADQVMQFFGNTNYQHIILLLRGLIAHGILLFVLQKKRWLVDYGLDPKRSLMAVPYRAKGVPSLNSEFGHPDVALLLTCLSYYYTGLTFDQLGQCFDLLFKETDPSDEYDRWYAGSPSLSEKLRGLHAINLEDSHLRTQDLFPHLQFNMVVIDFYLNKVVFPREGKEFPTKLSASGWDIPAHESEQITTGFSGTNDNRFLLPLSIRQADLPELRHTNAMVLNLLLQPENRLYLYARDQEGQRLSVEGLLRLIARQEPSIQVLLDVGAQVLEMKNREVAEAWLRCVPTAEAAVFFDEGDEVMVLSRRGLYERLVVSPFHHRLENCLIYLDEVHTRGVDLDIPAGVRAAVTLGPRLIKDRLVQACLRMRKMGCGHSLAFFGPPEVHQSIRAFVEKDSTAQLDAADVVRWSLEQTCKLTKDNKSLWVMQGFEHDQRTRACRALAAGSASLESVMSDDGRVQAFGERIQVAESHTLEEMYGPRSGPCAPSSNATESDADDEGDGDVLTELHRVWHTLDPTSVRDGVMHEEQEREVAHEIERERQVQRPGKLGFRASHLHPTVKHFVQYGTFPPGNIQDAVRSAARSLDHTMVTRLLADADMWPQLWATVDFAQTVDAKGGHTDEYLRPVNWILTSSASHAAVIISPYEANELIPTIKRSNRVRLHMYAARTTGTMVSFADLSFYTLTGDTPPYEAPPAMIRNLHLFGGSLYLDDWTQYCAVCHHLGILMKRDTIDDGVRVSSDGFVDEAGRALLRWPVSSPFKTSPLPFLKALLGLRMKGGSFPQTHLGSLVEGRTLGAESFEERQDR